MHFPIRIFSNFPFICEKPNYTQQNGMSTKYRVDISLCIPHFEMKEKRSHFSV